jgi:predicted ATPase
LLAIEEPENQLFPDLLLLLAEEFRNYANRGGQVFISTHSPYLLNALKLNEIYWLKKACGFTSIEKADNSAQLRALVEEGDLPGAIWKQGLFEEIGQ